MSGTAKNRKTLLLGGLVILVLVGICFGCVTLYARRELHKPKFHIPEQPAPPPLTQTLTDSTAAFTYAMQKYRQAVEADNTEGTWKTEMRIDGDPQTPFSDSDEAILTYIRNNAGDQLKSMYPDVSHIRMTEAQDVPLFYELAQDVLDFTVTVGRKNDKKEIVDTDRYFLTLHFDPTHEDTARLLQSETFRKITDELSPVASLSDTQIEAKRVQMCFAIDRITEELRSLDVERDLRVTAAFRLTDDAAALLDVREGTVELPYCTTQKIEFLHYGAHFSESAIAVKPKDIKALPAVVSVNENATKADYTLTFTSSDPDALTFDADGVMTVGKNAVDDPVTVTMTLDYNGRTYTDTLTVYISPWDVETEETTEATTETTAAEEVTTNVGA